MEVRVVVAKVFEEQVVERNGYAVEMKTRMRYLLSRMLQNQRKIWMAGGE
jgi:hypothetical protein